MHTMGNGERAEKKTSDKNANIKWYCDATIREKSVFFCFFFVGSECIVLHLARFGMGPWPCHAPLQPSGHYLLHAVAKAVDGVCETAITLAWQNIRLQIRIIICNWIIFYSQHTRRCADGCSDNGPAQCKWKWKAHKQNCVSVYDGCGQSCNMAKGAQRTRQS